MNGLRCTDMCKQQSCENILNVGEEICDFQENDDSDDESYD